MEALAVNPAAHLTGHDSESAMPVAALLQMPSTCTPVTEAAVHGDGSHVKDARPRSGDAAVELLAVYPAAQFTVQDSESAMLITAAATAVSMHFACEGGRRPDRACHGGTTGPSSCGAIRGA